MDCESVHPGTGVSFKDKLGYNCNTNCPIPDLLPENMLAMELIWRFGALIYNGETIDAAAINLICDWNAIPKSHRWLLSQKITAYFATLRSESSKELNEKHTEKPTFKGRK